MIRTRPEDKIFNTLRIKMDLAAILPREAFQQFGEGTLSAVAAVHERRHDGQPQVRASVTDRGAVEGAGEAVVAETVETGSPAGWRQTARRQRGLANGTRCRGAATGRRLSRNPGMRPIPHT